MEGGDYCAFMLIKALSRYRTARIGCRHWRAVYSQRFGMKGSPIHQNLSTSFVDLSLLVRFLRDRRFTGTVRVEWDGYDGEIFFTRSPRLYAREYDRSIGRIAQGQNAFRRILQRSRRPSGTIRIVKNDPDRTVEVLKKPFVDEGILSQARTAAFGKGDTIAELPLSMPETSGPAKVPGDRTRAALLATDLLLSFKDAFEKTRIGFDSAFALGCAFVADEFPFLDPDQDDFSFYKDEIFIGDEVETLDLFEGITSALRHMIDRMAADERFVNSVVYLRHRLQLHLSSRDGDYRYFRLTAIVDRLIR